MSEQKPRILVVEDEPQVAAEICVRLEALGYEPIGPVDTAAKALRSASLQAPDLVLMDIVLPGGMDGVEAAAELLRQCIPVVYLTAYANDDLLHRAKITEPMGYLVKPYTDRELQAAVVMALYRHRIERQLAGLHDLLTQSRDELERKVDERTAHLEELNARLREEMRERALTESALRESKERLRVLLEVSSDWAWEVDAQGCYTYVSPKVSDLLGYTAAEVIGRTPFDLMPAAEAERVAGVFAEAVARRDGIHCLENINRHHDGRLVVLETSGVPIIDAQGIFHGYRGVNRDITARKRTERALHESGRHLRQIIDMVPHMIFAKDMEGRMLMCNKSCADAYGLKAQELVGKAHVEVHEQASEVEHMLADDRRVITSGQPLLIPEEDFTDVYGNLRILRTLKMPYHPLESDQLAMLGIAIDITEQKHIEQKLRASEERYRALLDNAVDAILIADADGRLADANKRAEILLGYSRDELQQMHALDLHPLEEHLSVIEVFQQLIKGGDTLVEHAVLCKDGSVLRVEVAATPISYGDQLVVQGIFRDVTERRYKEAERLRQERAHRDTLIREVHHRIKNNLQGVIGLLYRHVTAHPELEHSMSVVVSQVQSIAVVHGLQGQGEDAQMRLCDMVREITRNASMLAAGNCAPDLTIAMPQSAIVDKDEAVAVALIINELLLNAMKHGTAEADMLRVRVKVSRVDSVAEVSVINPGYLPADFDFTANKGCGTGLGLVYSLLPTEGVRLEIMQVDAEVRACLRLSAPVVRCE